MVVGVGVSDMRQKFYYSSSVLKSRQIWKYPPKFFEVHVRTNPYNFLKLSDRLTDEPVVIFLIHQISITKTKKFACWLCSALHCTELYIANTRWGCFTIDMAHMGHQPLTRVHYNVHCPLSTVILIQSVFCWRQEESMWISAKPEIIDPNLVISYRSSSKHEYVEKEIIFIWEESVMVWIGKKKSGIFTLYTFGFLDQLHFCCFDENYHVF